MESKCVSLTWDKNTCSPASEENENIRFIDSLKELTQTATTQIHFLYTKKSALWC